MLTIKSYQDFAKILDKKIKPDGVVFGVGVTAFMRFFAGLFLDNYKIITFKDSKDNKVLQKYADEIFILKQKKPSLKLDFTNTNNILRNKTVQNYIKAHKGRKYLFLYKADKNIAKAIKGLGVKIIANSGRLNKMFENKVNFRKQLAIVGLTPIKGETMKFSRFLNKDFQFFYAKYGPRFVLQLPDFRLGGGKGTLFIESEKKFNQFKKEAQSGVYKNKELTCVNITQFIEGKSCSVACCATKYGALVSKIQQQILDIPQIIAAKKGNGLFCGHVFGNEFKPQIVRQAQIIAQKLGDYMYKKGYKGIFGIDLIINEKENKVYPVECNARYTGAFPMLSMLHLKYKIIPLDFFHFLEFLHIPYKINVARLNKMYQKKIQGSHIIISNIRNHPIKVKNELEVGTYGFSRNKIRYLSDNIFYEGLKSNSDFILVDGVPKKGAEIKKWSSLARICHVLFKSDILKANDQELKDKYLNVVCAVYKAMFGKKQP